MIKFAAVSLGAVLALAGSAVAADLPQRAPAPVAPQASAYDWTGAYVGAFGGYGWGTLNYTPTSVPAGPLRPAGSFAINGGIGGLTAGYNLQTGQMVIGVEGDIGLSKIAGTGAPLDPLSVNPTVPSASIDWLGTVRARIGVASDNFLIYGTGGLAVGGVTASMTNVTGLGDDRTQSGTQVGWAAGAGVEAAVTDNLTVKAEYLYTDLGTASYSFAGPIGPVVADAHPAASLVRAGLNFKF